MAVVVGATKPRVKFCITETVPPHQSIIFNIRVSHLDNPPSILKMADYSSVKPDAFLFKKLRFREPTFVEEQKIASRYLHLRRFTRT